MPFNLQILPPGPLIPVEHVWKLKKSLSLASSCLKNYHQEGWTIEWEGRGETRRQNRACEKSEETKVLGVLEQEVESSDPSRRGRCFKKGVHRMKYFSCILPRYTHATIATYLFSQITKDRSLNLSKFLHLSCEIFLRNALNQFHYKERDDKLSLYQRKINFHSTFAITTHTHTHTILRLSQPLKFPFSKYTTQRPITTKQSLLPTSSQQAPTLNSAKETIRGAKELEREKKKERKNSWNYNPE